VWNVHDATLTGNDRTNNLCEAWNRGLSSVVGHDHPSVWVLIENLRADAAEAIAAIYEHERGQPTRKRIKRSTKENQERLRRICEARRDDVKSVEDTLRAAGHSIRFV
jgi:hypothetical protein